MGFSHFSPTPKKCEGYPPVESESARQVSAHLSCALSALDARRDGGGEGGEG